MTRGPEERAGASATRAPPLTSPARVRRLRDKLLAWYDVNKRDLPWRHARDPYAIWISETMLQQTRVEAVIGYYHRFLERFPDIHSLATADRDDVYQVWAGLGYYRRARNLHHAAQQVVDEFHGELPNEVDSLRSLPGIGRYTAGALASIAFDQPEAIVDGNVTRVLSRVLGIRDDVSKTWVQQRIWDEAAAFARGPRPGDLNQALMELGATRCTPRSPTCAGCPVARSCDARRHGDADSLPIKTKKKRPRPVVAVAAWIPRRRTILAVRRPESGLLADLWELPGGNLTGDSEPAAGLCDSLRESTGLRVDGLEAAGEVEHVFTHLRLHLHLFRCRAVEGRVRLSWHREHRWIRPGGFERLPHAAVTRKALALLT